MNHKLESIVPGKIQQPQICTFYQSNGRKGSQNTQLLNEDEKGKLKTWLKTQHLKNKDHGIWSHQLHG